MRVISIENNSKEAKVTVRLSIDSLIKFIKDNEQKDIAVKFNYSDHFCIYHKNEFLDSISISYISLNYIDNKLNKVLMFENYQLSDTVIITECNNSGFNVTFTLTRPS